MIERERRLRLIRIVFWIVAISLAGLQAWSYRYFMNPDGISYLDQADAWFRGDWSDAVNAWWSPGYAWLLGLGLWIGRPQPRWEFAVVHLVNWVIFLGALFAFDFLLREWLAWRRTYFERVVDAGAAFLSDELTAVLAYVLFLWVSLCVIGLQLVTPDMAVSATVYVLCGLLLRMRRTGTRTGHFALLGLLLGLGYLLKAPMLPLAPVFLLVAIWGGFRRRRAIVGVLTALAVLLVVAGPFVAALSLSKGRFTFGESGRVNYAWWVNGVRPFAYWQGGPPGSGVPIHPAREAPGGLSGFEFAAPVGGTFPTWYDPSYWYEGVRPHFDAASQLRLLGRNTVTYGRLSLRGYRWGLVAGLLVLIVLNGQRIPAMIRGILRHWILLVPALLALLMYLSVLVVYRYVGGFVALLWMAVFGGLTVHDTPARKRVLWCVAVVVTLLLFAEIASESTSSLLGTIRGDTRNRAWETARELSRLGVSPGDRVAVIGNAFESYWARPLHVTIVAQVLDPEEAAIWTDGERRTVLLRWLASTGAKAVVIEDHPAGPPPPDAVRLDKDRYAVILK